MIKETILVTGGLGFMGVNIVQHLLENTQYSIKIIDKFSYAGQLDNLQHNTERVNVIQGDITKVRDINTAMKQVSYVIHLAADTHTRRSITHPLQTIKTNILGTTILLDAAVKNRCQRFIQFSSSEVYGNQVQQLEMNELHPLNPVTPYAASKLSADRIVNSYYLSKNLPVSILRPFNTYGPYQHPEKMIPLFITNLLRGEKIRINNSGEQYRDFIYVKDIASAVTTMITHDFHSVVGKVFNVGTGKPSTIISIAKKICQYMNKNPNEWIELNKQNTIIETKGNVGISTYLTTQTGWKPTKSIDTGLKETIVWYTANSEWWKKRIHL